MKISKSQKLEQELFFTAVLGAYAKVVMTVNFEGGHTLVHKVINTGCIRRNLPYFGRTFRKLISIDKTPHTCICSCMITGVML
jgi:hypothetical protein